MYSTITVKYRYTIVVFLAVLLQSVTAASSVVGVEYASPVMPPMSSCTASSPSARQSCPNGSRGSSAGSKSSPVIGLRTCISEGSRSNVFCTDFLNSQYDFISHDSQAELIQMHVILAEGILVPPAPLPVSPLAQLPYNIRDPKVAEGTPN